MSDWVQLAATAATQTEAAFAEVAEVAGVALDRATYGQLQTLAQSADVQVSQLLAMCARVLRSEEGIHYERLEARPRKVHCLLVRLDEGGAPKVAIDVDRSRHAGLARSWPELAPWKKQLADNRARCEAWARAPQRCRLDARTLPPEVKSAKAAVDDTGLLQAVIAHPDDDGPRLVYADWLEEHGNARAQVIRKQLALEQLGLYSPERRTLAAEVEALLQAGWRDFAGKLARYTSAKQFRRGFVDSVTMTIPAFEKDGAWVFAAEPVARLHVKERNFTAADLARLAQAPAAQHVRQLSLGQVEPGSDRLPLAALADGPGFPKLQRLSLFACGHSVADWQQLFERLNAPRLQEVGCHYNHTSSGLYRGLARNPSLAQLASVDEYVYQPLDGKKAGPLLNEAIAELAATRSAFTTWKSGNNGAITDDVVAHFYGPKSVVAMQHFALNNVPGLTDRFGFTLAASPKAEALRVLATHNSSLKVKGVRAVLDAAKHLQELRLVAFQMADAPGQAVWLQTEWDELARSLISLPADHPLKTIELRGSGGPNEKLGARLAQRYGRWDR